MWEKGWDMIRDKIRLAPFMVLLLLALPAPQAQSEEAPAAKTSLGFPVLQDLKPLCSGNNLAQNGDEIVWEVYTSTEKPGNLTAAYQNRLGKQHWTPQGEGGSWKIPEAGEGKPGKPPAIARVLDIGPAADYHPLAACGKKPPPEALSVVMASAYYRRAAK